ncbi:MAG TPA: polysaccharide biosynthesis tyrosine autokinase [Candidatus Binatia bacterium]|jgi:capsular exopolysaccharide synthesis family protein
MAETPSPYLIKRNSSQEDAAITLSPFMEVEEGSNFRDYWILLRRYRWLILACVVAVVSLVMLYTFTRTPIYTAQATLLIERKPPQVLKMQDALAEQIDTAEYYKTQYEILKSRALAERVIKAQGMDKKPIFASQESAGKTGFVAGLLQQFSEAPKKSAEAMPGANAGIIDAYLSMVKIQPIRGTGLVQVAFSTPDPALSAQLANVHSASYVRYGLDLRSKTNEEALAFLEKKLLELKERVEKSEASLNAYRRDKGIISLSDKENIVVDRLGDLNKRLTDAEAERINLEANLRAIRSGNVDVLPAAFTSPVAQGLKGDITRLENEQTQLAKEFKPGYPPLDKVTAQLENSQRRLKSELQNSVRSVEMAYQAAKTREAELRARMEEQKAATLDLKDSAVQYAILAREVDTNKQLYDGVLQRMREMGVAAQVQNSNVYVVDKAEVPSGPSYPLKTRSLLLGLSLGLAIGIGVVLLKEHLDRTFKSPEELERYIQLPHLAVVPDFERLNNREHGYGYGYVSKILGAPKSDNGKLPASASPTDIIEQHPLSVGAEAYRALRSALLLARASGPPRTVLLASATRGEGKTTTLVNTAIVFAQTRARVLIIDADLRRPRCHRILKIENTTGLAEVLAGQVEIENVIRPTRVDNLFVVTSGAIPPDPAELLGSQEMAKVLNDLRERFDYIFMDSSPLLPVTDAVLLATMVDGVLMVVDGQKTPRQAVKNARARLTSAKIKILGVLLNRVDVLEGSYAGYYGQYYKYYGPDDQEQNA